MTAALETEFRFPHFFSEGAIEARPLDKGMGVAIGRRTVFRPQDQQDMGRVADRVAEGNLSMIGLGRESDEFQALRNAIASGALITSGRHLQHGDADQKNKSMELHTNCLDGNEKILTLEYGPIEIAKVAGRVVTVISGDGTPREARVNAHGRQVVNRIVFRQNTSGFGKFRHEVLATANHRWKLLDGSITDDLKVNDVIAPADASATEDKDAVLHGLIFGDGHSHKTRVDLPMRRAMQGRDYCTIRLCSEKDKDLLPLFEGYTVTYPEHAGGDPVVYVGKRQFWKDLPFSNDPSYIAGFIKGWWLADGSKSVGYALEISTANKAAVAWVREHAGYAGYTVTMHRIQKRKSGDGSFPNGKDLHVIRLRRKLAWKVESITSLDEREVYCPEEPVTGLFVLANGLLTGNCSSAALSFQLFTLLLSGSGVGRCYDDKMMVVDWRQAPKLQIILSDNHPDYPKTPEQLFRFGREFGLLPFAVADGVDEEGVSKTRSFTMEDFAGEYVAEVIAFRDRVLTTRPPEGIEVDEPYRFWTRFRSGGWAAPAIKAENDLEIRRGKTVYYRLADTREGWGKGAELYEAMAFERKRSWLLALDYTNIRPLNAPIGGMQERPASGPLSVLRAFLNIQTKVVEVARRTGMERWEQACRVDHYYSEEVQVGGARRAARMSTKSWRDRGVLDFIVIKSRGGLWTSNNSVMVDAEFWRCVHRARRHVAAHGTTDGLSRLARHALEVFELATANAYINGEPGFINGDKLESIRTGKARQRPVVTDGSDFGSSRYKASWGAGMLAAVAKHASKTIFPMVVNPCVTADSWVLTTEGSKQVKDLIDRPFTAVVDGVAHGSTGFWYTGDKAVLRIATQRGYEIRVTANHKVKVERDRKYRWHRVDGKMRKKDIQSTFEWVEAGDLKVGDRLVVGNNRGFQWEQDHDAFDQGWLVGEIIGDGGYNPTAYNAYLRFWGESAEYMANLAAEITSKLPRNYHAPTSFGGAFPNRGDKTWMVQGRMLRDLVDGLIEPCTKTPMAALEGMPMPFQAGVLRGMFDADGSVQGDVRKGRSVRLTQVNLEVLRTAQRMLARFGIASTLYEGRKDAGVKMLPDGHGNHREYPVQALHELVVSRDNMLRFRDAIGFYEPEKMASLDALIETNTRGEYAEMFTSEVVAITEDGVEPVYDCTVDGAHAFDCNGLIVHNCGEVELHVLGAYCVIADFAPLLSCPYDFMNRPAGMVDDDEAKLWDERIEETVRLAVRFCMRVNLMDSLYHREVARTNRIGVGPTGIHEFAWARFGFDWHDLLNEKLSAPFWDLMARLSDAAKDEARIYAELIGVEVPHTVTTVKPAGSTSKLYGLSEGAHLPARRQYLRWVQFRGQRDANGVWLADADRLLAQYEASGYPIRELQTFPGMSIVGFPTVPLIVNMGIGERIVTAPEATPEDQFRYLQLLERHWIGAEQGNQVSYTMKVFTDQHDLNSYRDLVATYQPTIRCCSVMPQKRDAEMGYEYLPEQEMSLDEFGELVAMIKDPDVAQEIDMRALQCASGVCPI